LRFFLGKGIGLDIWLNLIGSKNRGRYFNKTKSC
jgi:hypothetical protein